MSYWAIAYPWTLLDEPGALKFPAYAFKNQALAEEATRPIVLSSGKVLPPLGRRAVPVPYVGTF